MVLGGGFELGDAEGRGRHPSTDRDAVFAAMLADAADLPSLCSRYLHDHAAAEDASQDTLLQAWRHRHRLEIRESQKPWLKVVARGRALNERRRRRRIDLVEVVPDDAVGVARDPAEIVGSAETLEETMRAFALLAPRERRVLAQQAFEGRTLREIADGEGCTVSAVKSLLTRARSKLHTLIQQGRLGTLAGLAAAHRWIRRHTSTIPTPLHPATPHAAGGLDRLGEVVGLVAAALLAGVLSVPSEPSAANAGPSTSISPPREVAREGEGPAHARAVAGGKVTAPAGMQETPVHAGDLEAHERGGQVPEEPGSDDRGLIPADVPSDPPVDPGEPPDEPLPRDEADDPDGASFRDLAWANSTSASGGEVFALGTIAHRCDSDCKVLFHSADGGATWQRHAPKGLGDDAHQILVAPGYPSDPRIYAMTSSGLRRSVDGGRSFHEVNAPVGGPAAMSPAFSSGDPRILIGLGSGWSYDADTDALAPFSPGSFATTLINFTFAPDAGPPGPVFAGHLDHRTGGGKHAAVTRCTSGGCDGGVVLDGLRGPPRLHVSRPARPDERVVLAWRDAHLFRSTDAGATFEPVDPGVTGSIAGVVGDATETLYLGWWDQDGATRFGGVQRSTDGGRTWAPVNADDAVGQGVVDLAVDGAGALLVAPRRDPTGGLRCSADGGETWAPRCPSR